MISQLLKHQWLGFTRSASFGREIGLAIFIVFISIIVFINLFVLALALPDYLQEMPDVESPIVFLNSILGYYFLTELFIRYFAQKTPVLSVEPYLPLPIRRSFIVRFLLVKSVFHPVNLIPVILFTPFAIKIVAPQEGNWEAFIWLAGIVITSFALHYFNIIFKKYLDDKGWVWAIIIGFAVVNFFFAGFIKLDLFAPVAWLFNHLISFPLILFIPLALMLVLTIVSYRLMINQLYVEEIVASAGGTVEKYTEKLNFLGQSGLVNALVLQELKMIFRHKRTRSMLILSLVLVGYGLIFFTNEDLYGKESPMYVFLGIFMSGIFTINYGQFLWSWNTNQMDFFFTRPMALNTWLKSRYQLILIACLLAIILSIPYLYFGWYALWVILAGGIYNIGINIPIMMRMSLWSPKPINLNQSSMFNYSGAGVAQWVMGIPVLLGPYIFYTPFAIIFDHNIGLIAVGLIGLIGFSLKNLFIKYMTIELLKNKYVLIKNLVI